MFITMQNKPFQELVLLSRCELNRVPVAFLLPSVSTEKPGLSCSPLGSDTVQSSVSTHRMEKPAAPIFMVELL
jgi:hypothetical protein